MDKETPIQFISRVAKEVGGIVLSSKCGKYTTVVPAGYDTCVISLEGLYGYKLTELSKLSKRTISKIYNDIKNDFE